MPSLDELGSMMGPALTNEKPKKEKKVKEKKEPKPKKQPGEKRKKKLTVRPPRTTPTPS